MKNEQFKMKIEFLKNNLDSIQTIANWYFDEWAYLKEGSSIESFTENLYTYLNTDRVPLMLVAVEGDKVVGAVQLKYREMTIYPDKEHWLGGVYVAKDHRRKKVAEQMILKLIEIAKSLGVKTLHLQTEHLDGGLYQQLGWQAAEQVNYRGIDVLVMAKDLTL